jgi:hypothetical protein
MKNDERDEKGGAYHENYLHLANGSMGLQNKSFSSHL